MTPDHIAATYLDATVRAAIRTRLRDRRWYRRMADAESRRYATYYADLGRENDVRLRELVRVARTARDLARPAIVREAASADALAAGDHFLRPVEAGR